MLKKGFSSHRNVYTCETGSKKKTFLRVEVCLDNLTKINFSCEILLQLRMTVFKINLI